MRFGVFHSPWHEPGRNPTVHLHQDLELVEHLDRLGFDEFWVGEHHSGGYELLGSPEAFLAAAAQRTRRIGLGSAVISVPYHHPLLVADRITYLDHLTRGRAMFGFGPGSLPRDAQMMGIDFVQTRSRLEEGVEAITRLLEDDEPVTMETDWFTLHEAKLNLHPFSWPRPELATAAVRSPTGPRLAGRFGTSMISISATETASFEFLADSWQIAEERAEEFGRQVDRANWRVVGPMYVSKTMESAIEETRHGFDGFLRFAGAASYFPEGPDIEDTLATTTHEMRVGAMNESRFTAVGPPELAIEQISRLNEQSGGFGTYLIQLFDFADREATFRSLELFAHEVMPHFQHSGDRAAESWQTMYDSRESNRVTWRGAQDKVIEAHEAERKAKAPR